MTRLCVMKDQMHAKLPDGRKFRFAPEGDPVFEARKDACEYPAGAKCWWCGLRAATRLHTWACSDETRSKCIPAARADGHAGIWIPEESP